MPGVLLKRQEIWVGYQLMQKWLKHFSLAAKVLDLTKPLLSLLLLSGMSMWTGIHGLMAGRRPLNVLEKVRGLEGHKSVENTPQNYINGFSMTA